ncbi:MAG: hypothetical protein EOP05_00380 [Proteobacteria bacterium]|nr:MAG: hypothetical protein EOP05_00380 [Pseudomonadota bacterium]
MKWIKKGRIFDHSTFSIPWFKKNAMVPVPYLVDKETLRLFVTMCDEDTVGRIGYVDVDPNNPSRVLGYSEKPVVDIGPDGAFDDNGVVTSSVLEADGKLYLYYSGYQLCVKVPYLIFSGVAVSEDKGKTFTKYSGSAPILDRIDGEIGSRCAPYVLRERDGYRMWYTSDSQSGWVESGGKRKPLYDLKTLKSQSPVEWPREAGDVAITFKDSDEHGIAKCSVWSELGKYRALYSIRSHSKGYRLGYAESADGVSFDRKDSEIGIDVSETGWDSEMVAFPERFELMGRAYLFYCGNNYGKDGIGYAELEGATQHG